MIIARVSQKDHIWSKLEMIESSSDAPLKTLVRAFAREFARVFLREAALTAYTRETFF